jgi:hypothetical protein
VTADADESTTVLELDLMYVLALLVKPPVARLAIATSLFYAIALSSWSTLAAQQSGPSPKPLPDGQLDRVNEGV